LTFFLLALIPIGCGGGSPSGVVKSALMKANAGKYSEAHEYLSSEMQKAFESGEMKKRLWDEITKQGTIKDIEILKEEVRGEGATVSFKITYKDGSVVESEESLVKEGGKWKVSFSDTLFKKNSRPIDQIDKE